MNFVKLAALAAILIAAPAAAAPAADPAHSPLEPGATGGPGPTDAAAIGPALVVLVPANPVCTGVDSVCAGVASAGAGYVDSFSYRPSWTIVANGLQYSCDGPAGYGSIRVAVLGNVIAERKACGGYWGAASGAAGARVEFVATMDSHYHFVSAFEMRAVLTVAPVAV